MKSKSTGRTLLEALNFNHCAAKTPDQFPSLGKSWGFAVKGVGCIGQGFRRETFLIFNKQSWRESTPHFSMIRGEGGDYGNFLGGCLLYKPEPTGQTLVKVHMLPPQRTGSIALWFNNIGPLVQFEANCGGAVLQNTRNLVFQIRMTFRRREICPTGIR